MPKGNFLVYYDGDRLINTEQAKAFFDVTEEQLLSLTVGGVLKSRIVLGKTLIAISFAQMRELLGKFNGTCHIQSLDNQLKELRLYADGDDIVDVVALPARTPHHKMHGALYVEFKHLPLDQKYNKRSYVPSVKLCGTLYAVLNMVRKEGKSYLIKLEEV